MYFVEGNGNSIEINLKLNKSSMLNKIKSSYSHIKDKNYRNSDILFREKFVEKIYDTNNEILRSLKSEKKEEYELYKKNCIKKAAIRSACVLTGAISGYLLGDSNISYDTNYIMSFMLLGHMFGQFISPNQDVLSKSELEVLDEKIDYHEFLEDKIVNYTTNNVLKNFKNLYKN